MNRLYITLTTLLLLQALLFVSCDELSTKPKLLFSSGFEDNVHIGKVIEGYQFIEGKDLQTGFSWPIDILGARESALHCIDDYGGKAVMADIRTVIGHNGKETKALYNLQNFEKEATQCPYEILDIVDGKQDLYIKYWIKLDSQSLHQKDKWRTFFEWKSKDYAEGEGFRLISFIYTDEDGNPYWHWQGDADPQHAIWEIDNKSVPVPEEEWFLTEFFWHWSNGQDGRAIWKVNGQLVADYRGPTTRNNKAIDFIMLTQIYGDANPKYQWIDDIEIWDSPPDDWNIH